DEPEVQATIPLGKKKPGPAEEEELPADEVSKPTPKDPKQAFKKPQPSKKLDEPTTKKKPVSEPEKKNIPRVKLPDDEPEVQATIPLGKKKPGPAEEEELPANEVTKPTPKDPKQAFKKPQPSKTLDEPTTKKKPVSEPEKKNIPRVKLPDDEPEARATIPLGKKKPEPAEEVELPAYEVSKPTPKDPKQAFKKPQPSKTLDEPTTKKKPVSESEKKNIPRVKLPDDEPEAQATIPLGKRKPKPAEEEELPGDEVTKPSSKDPKQAFKKPQPSKTLDEPTTKKKPVSEPEKKNIPRVKLPNDEPEARVTIPLGKKKPEPAEEVELPADEVSKPTPKDPKQAFKKPQPSKTLDEPTTKKKPVSEPEKKNIPRVKLPDDEPEAQATIPLRKKKPEPTDEEELPADEISKPIPKDPKRAFKKPQPSKTVDEPTTKKKPVNEPKKKNIPKVKLPDDEREAQATIPLRKKKPEPAYEEELPADEISKPILNDPKQAFEKPQPGKTIDEPSTKKKPVSDPGKENIPMVKLHNDEPETNPTNPLKKKKPKRKPGKSISPENPDNSQEKAIPLRKRWVPPVKILEPPIPMPPNEKSIAEINKLERIPPIQRYSKKPKSIDVFIPFVIPWEQWPAIMTQEGMGAFGKPRDTAIKVDPGSKELKQGDLKSETVIPLLNDNRGQANRSGMLPFGSRRRNLGVIVDSHNYSMQDNGSSEGIIPLLGRGAIDHGHLRAGDLRPQVANVEYTDRMDPEMDKSSHGFISRYFASNSKEKVGTNIIDRRRGEVAPCGSQARDSEQMIPLMFDGRSVEQKEGSEFGSFRPLISTAIGGYTMTYDDELRCKNAIPFQVSANTSRDNGSAFNNILSSIYLLSYICKH
uniref:Titin n=1 Tax=Angiostrongylus cantonensis TaxID=6313 RepID=A0A0K0D2R3_ANGCA